MGRERLALSIVVPIFNEEESVFPLYKAIRAVCDSLNRSFEIIFVDDGSQDQSFRQLSRIHESDRRAKVVRFRKNYGQTAAMSAGFRAARGEVVVSMDGDLQNDPTDIPKMLKKMKEGYDCVCGWRKARQDTLLKAGLSKFGNVMQRLFTGMNIHDVSCTLRIYKRECISKIALNWEGQHRFIPLSLSLQGYRIGEIISNHRLRQYGTTKYSHKRVFRVVKDFFKVLKAKGRE